HHTSLRANTTIRCPGLAPVTRPAMTSIVSGPPLSAGGIFVNTMVGCGDEQAVSKRTTGAINALRQGNLYICLQRAWYPAKNMEVFDRGHANIKCWPNRKISD